MMKSRYLRHPFRTANAAKAMLAARFNMRRLAAQGARRFRGDVRFDLQSVTDGFASRIDDSVDDSALLERICTAYVKAVEQQQFAAETYKATKWWEQVRARSLGPVTRALQTHDIDALGKMYRNFFRDPCSTGLIGVPYGMTDAYFCGTIKDVHRSFYLSNTLCLIDHWAAQTCNRFALHDLAGPEIGNPFGVLIEGTLLRVGGEYAHYCAQRVGGLLDSGKATVAEIGGGFGSMAYYLLRDRASVTYLDFDVPESIALSSYYLLKAFPKLTFLLYGEEELTKEAIERVDVVLMPVFELATMPAGSIDVTFSSHAMSDIAPEAMDEYLIHIARMTKSHFLHIGNGRASKSISDLVGRSFSSLKLAGTRASRWQGHKISGAASAMFEQRYTQTIDSRDESGEPLLA